MCTSFTLKSDNNTQFFARTMDFSFQLAGRPIVIPRNYDWHSQLGNNYQTRFGLVGTGVPGEPTLLIDGMNEKGLAAAELYFPHLAKYQGQQDEAKVNVAPHEFLLWLLGTIESIAELKVKIATVSLIDIPAQILGDVVPLHFIVADKTGQCVVIETNQGEIQLKDNPVGVMTNSPQLEWHLQNLNNYLSLQPYNFSAKNIGSYQAHPYGLGTGTSGLPGGLTSPERFVRAVYMKEHIVKGTNSEEGLNAVFQLLHQAAIPKGVMLESDGQAEYTQYKAAFNLSELNYSFSPYENQQIFSLHLDERLLNANEPTEFSFEKMFAGT